MSGWRRELSPASEAIGVLEPEALPQPLHGAMSELLLAIADDALLIGHRDSEWTGLGPILEEDIAFSSMAQDELGHALVLYGLRHEHLGAPAPDVQAFQRDAGGWRNAHFTELPRSDYAFSLIRRTLYDLAAATRYDALSHCPWTPVAAAATKLRQEKKYHLVHDRVLVQRLGSATEESRDRLQSALDIALPYGLGVWEPTRGEGQLVTAGLTVASEELGRAWLDQLCSFLVASGLKPAATEGKKTDSGPISGRWHALDEPRVGGRSGEHTEHLEPLLAAMQGMYRSDPEARW